MNIYVLDKTGCLFNYNSNNYLLISQSSSNSPGALGSEITGNEFLGRVLLTKLHLEHGNIRTSDQGERKDHTVP